jgi:ribosomal protein S18 acetylase RimI-like enzyme
VVDHVTEVANSVEAEPRPKFRDARILKKAIRESILTSPGSFLKTVADVDTMSADLWDKEVDTYTWAVIQQFGNVVGIAVARWPDKDIDHNIDEFSARFIESVWIAPILRGSHLGERLVNYLIEEERKRHPAVSHFMLWVFKDNKRAIRLYRRMHFKRVGKHALEDHRIELRYEYVLRDMSHKNAVRRSRANAVARERDQRLYGITYRVLGPDIPNGSPR